MKPSGCTTPEQPERSWRRCTERCFAVTEEERCVDCPSRLPQARPTASPYDLSGNPTEDYPVEGGAAVERKGVCRVCHRALKNPAHAAAGIGPVCARKHGSVVRDLSRVHVQRLPPYNEREATFDVVKVTPEVVWIRDRDEDGKISVTNDAESVVMRLHNRYPGARVIYQDTIGRWDELKHDGKGTFTGFAPAADMAPA